MDFKVLILQILNQADSIISIPEQKQITLLELLTKGGIMMIPIFILFIVTIYILIEKMLVLNRESKLPKNFTDEIINRVKNDDINGAKLICKDTKNPVSRMILKGLNKLNTNLKNIESSRNTIVCATFGGIVDRSPLFISLVSTIESGSIRSLVTLIYLPLIKRHF